MKAILTSLCLLLLCLSLSAQSFEIRRDSVGFYMLSGSGQTRFDTAQVVTTLTQKRTESTAIETEIQLLERLVVLRRQLAATKSEETTLSEILEKARRCKIEKQ